MPIRWENTLTGGLREIHAKSKRLDDDMYEGARVVLEDSDRRVPKRSGDLVESGHIKRDRAGLNTVAVVYSSVYARWIHEHLTFHHPVGGTAKFLELAMLEKGHDAMNDAAEHFWRRL